VFKGIIGRLFGRKQESAPTGDVTVTLTANKPADVSRAVLAAVAAALQVEDRPQSTARQKPIPVHAVGDDEWAAVTKTVIEELIAEGAQTYNAIKRGLDARGMRARKGGVWQVAGIQLFIKKHGIAFETKGVRYSNLSKGQVSSPVVEVPKRKPAYKSITTEAGARIRKTPVKNAEDVSDIVMNRVTNEVHPLLNDPLDMLDDPVKSRAKIVREHRQNGGTNRLTTAEIDAEIRRRVEAGEITKLPAGIDSQGKDHFDYQPMSYPSNGLQSEASFVKSGRVMKRRAGVSA